MSRWRCLAVAGLLAGLPAGVVWGQTPGASSTQHTVRGIVAAVHHDHHYITLRVHHQTSTGQLQSGHYAEWHFRVTSQTHFEIVGGTKPQTANFHALRRGEQVVVHTAAGESHVAARVVIHRHHHHGQTATTQTPGTRPTATASTVGTTTASTQPIGTTATAAPTFGTQPTKTTSTGTTTGTTMKTTSTGTTTTGTTVGNTQQGGAQVASRPSSGSQTSGTSTAHHHAWRHSGKK